MNKIIHKQRAWFYIFHTLRYPTVSILVVSVLFLEISCKKIVNVDPPITGLSSATVFTNDINAASAVTGIYQSIMQSPGEFSGGNRGISLKLGLASDEFVPYFADNSLSEIYANKTSTVNDINYISWAFYYKYIFQCNLVLENLNKSNQISSSIKSQLTGEAKFMRAFLYFYLENIYGDVPLILTSDYRENTIAKRTDTSKVSQQIILDLTEAAASLTREYRTPSGLSVTERVRPNAGAATALLARIYLYQRDWEKAENAATNVINDPQYSLSDDLTTVFNKNSSETILQFQPTGPNFNTYDGYCFILNNSFNSSSPVALREDLINSFESGDLRLKFWIGKFNDYFFPFKYRIKGGNSSSSVDEYLMVLRIAEQYLIRAEARAELGNINNAIDDINIIRTRAGLAHLSKNNISKDSVLSVIMHERQLEMFAEWGNRWLDMKRTGRLDAIMNLVAPKKNSTWNAFARLFPIPSVEILKNPALTQNTGY